jgi:SpoVK/Ycf46/Vps4 family AAA+-type ATPase
MDPDLKALVRADLESFLKGRAYYHRLGRIWRRSYLLYGAPGTGKSTFAEATNSQLFLFTMKSNQAARVLTDVFFKKNYVSTDVTSQ